jgi:hypothetical protein
MNAMKRISGLMLMAGAMILLGAGPSAFAASVTQETTPEQFPPGPCAGADEPIVGYWQVTWKDADTHEVVAKIWDVWHADRTETENDTFPILTGNVCQGAWIPLGHRTYGLTHPAFNFLSAPEDQEGQPDPNSSGLILERVTVSNDGNSYQGRGLVKTIAGMDPLDPHAAVLSSEKITITAKRVQVDKSQLP